MTETTDVEQGLGLSPRVGALMIGAVVVVIGILATAAGGQTDTFGEMEAAGAFYVGLALVWLGSMILLVGIVATGIIMASREMGTERPKHSG